MSEFVWVLDFMLTMFTWLVGGRRFAFSASTWSSVSSSSASIKLSIFRLPLEHRFSRFKEVVRFYAFYGLFVFRSVFYEFSSSADEGSIVLLFLSCSCSLFEETYCFFISASSLTPPLTVAFSY